MLIMQNLALQNASVFIRCDFNVPLDNFGNILDDRRIRETLPTIYYCLDHGCKIILASHLGRPKGNRDKKLSLFIVAKRLERLLQQKIDFSNDIMRKDTKKRVENLQNGEILLLENLRFEKGEINNNLDFAKKLANLTEFYINDAFGVSHRAQASTEAITHFFDKKHKGAGFLLQKEVNFLQTILQKPIHPFTLIIGGSKISTKLDVLKYLLPKVDKMLIGGGMAFTFLKAQGYEVGRSIVENDLLESAIQTITLAKEHKVKLFFPVDFIIAKKLEQEAKSKIVTFLDIPKEYMGVDIGPSSLILFKEALEEAKTIIWNGPVGVFEINKFAQSSLQLAQYIASLHATKVIGGGDTAEMIHKAGVTDNMTFVSTGGGASLELLSGKTLPGILALAN